MTFNKTKFDWTRATAQVGGPESYDEYVQLLKSEAVVVGVSRPNSTVALRC